MAPSRDDLIQSLLALLRSCPGRVRLDICSEGESVAHIQLPPVGAGALTPATPVAPPAAHAEDFRSVSWDGHLFQFSRKQALVIKRLWEGMEAGLPDVSQEILLRACGSDGLRLVDLFRRSDAWGTLIVSEQAGSYRLSFS